MGLSRIEYNILFLIERFGRSKQAGYALGRVAGRWIVTILENSCFSPRTNMSNAVFLCVAIIISSL